MCSHLGQLGLREWRLETERLYRHHELRENLRENYSSHAQVNWVKQLHKHWSANLPEHTLDHWTAENEGVEHDKALYVSLFRNEK